MSNIKINPDKTISINEKKTFPVSIYGAVNILLDSVTEPALTSIKKNKDFLFTSGQTWLDVQNGGYQKMFEDNGLMFLLGTRRTSSTPQSIIDSPMFFGWMNTDEPAPGVGDIDGCPATDTEQQCFDRVLGLYNAFKARDPNHPVLMAHWRDLPRWEPCGDILTWDAYCFRDDEGWNKGYWTRLDALYAYEHYSWHNALLKREISTFSKPICAVLEGYGQPIQDGGGHILPATPQEIRCNTYLAITMGVQGIGYFLYKGWPMGADGRTAGLFVDQTLHAYYTQLARELKLFNDILVLPTKDYSWEYRKGTSVSFSKTLTKDILGRTRTNFNYILKQSGSTTYLIVVNKDPRSISDVRITISGLTGTISAKTIGLESSGSGRTGKVLTVNNGQFTDSFDGYAVHIYQIGSDTSIPCVPNWKCELPLNGYESDGCGNRRLNPECNIIPKKYKCSGAPFYQCSEDATGTYNALDVCNAACAIQKPALSSILVTPGIATIIVGESVTVVGTAIDSHSVTMGGIPIVWTSDPAGIVEIDPINTATFIDGKISTKIKGIAPGMCIIKGTSGSISGQLILDVNIAPPLPPSIKWKYSGAPDCVCIEDPTGTFNSQSECQAVCNKTDTSTKDNEKVILAAIAALTFLR